MKSILGRKIGMTQIFSESGEIIPVTVVSAGPCMVIQIKTVKKEGYNAVQVGFNAADEKELTKPVAGHCKKSCPAFFKKFIELKVEKPEEYKPGQEIKCDIFASGEYVDVQGVSKGHGFQGVVKRHGFHGGPSSHGQSDKQRSPGSIGAQQPQRVLKGTRMAGRMGGMNVTVQKLEIAKIMPEENILLIKGAVPGVKNGMLMITQTTKKRKFAVVKKKAPAKEEKKGTSKKELKK